MPGRWSKAPQDLMAQPAEAEVDAVPPPPMAAAPGNFGAGAAPVKRQKKALPSAGASFILQHYHSTGCAGGAFSFRAAMLDPKKELQMCVEPREYRATAMEQILYSKEDKRRGGGPRVGPFQETIPGDGWKALPKYDFTTTKRSSQFNERMHVEWENHVDHVLLNGGKLPTASVVAKAGFRSCAPCCRDMVALAQPTGKTFIMVDLAEDDAKGTFHFVTGDKYLPIPKEACTRQQVCDLKKLVLDAQQGKYLSSEDVHAAAVALGAPVDRVAQSLYRGDRALLPPGCAKHLEGEPLLRVIHAEHFARLAAEYGASILRDPQQPWARQEAVRQCRAIALQALLAAWRPHLPWASAPELEAYADAAVAPLLPEERAAYQRMRNAMSVPVAAPAAAVAPPVKERRRWVPVGASKATSPVPSHLQAIHEGRETLVTDLTTAGPMDGGSPGPWKKGDDDDDGAASTAGAPTALPEDDDDSGAAAEDDACTEVDDGAEWEEAAIDAEHNSNTTPSATARRALMSEWQRVV